MTSTMSDPTAGLAMCILRPVVTSRVQSSPQRSRLYPHPHNTPSNCSYYKERMAQRNAWELGALLLLFCSTCSSFRIPVLFNGRQVIGVTRRQHSSPLMLMKTPQNVPMKDSRGFLSFVKRGRMLIMGRKQHRR